LEGLQSDTLQLWCQLLKSDSWLELALTGRKIKVTASTIGKSGAARLNPHLYRGDDYMKPVNRVDFRITPKGLYGNTVLVAGLLFFVWVHWHGQRHVELVVFSVLAVLAISLYTLRSGLCLSLKNREISGTRTWLGMAIRKVVVRVGGA
jgi:hypothetical protein